MMSKPTEQGEHVKSPEEKAYEVAVETRKLEIELFWSRSLFFWGFIASAFVAYAALRRFHSDISLVAACFGFVCSFAWSLVNRGSKFWQESWETKVERLEVDVTGPLFAKPEAAQTHKGLWLRGRQFSVSKLAMALSDYTVILWVSIIGWELIRLTAPNDVAGFAKEFGVWGFAAFSIIYGVSALGYGRSSPPSAGYAAKASTEAVSPEQSPDNDALDKAQKAEAHDALIKHVFDNLRNIFLCMTIALVGGAILHYRGRLPLGSTFNEVIGSVVIILSLLLFIWNAVHGVEKLTRSIKKGTVIFWLAMPAIVFYMIVIFSGFQAFSLARSEQMWKRAAQPQPNDAPHQDAPQMPHKEPPPVAPIPSRP